MSIQKFQDIIAWQRSQDLAYELYRTFERHTDYGFKNQLLRAVISVSNNIAEGFERRGNKEFKRFLRIASCSCSETKSMLILAKRIGNIDSRRADQLIQLCNEVGRLINGLLNSLK